MSKDKRGLVVAGALLVLAAAAVFGSTKLTWLSTTVEDLKQPARSLPIDGGTWAPALTGVSLVLLAAIAAAVALKGVWRKLVALIVAAAGIASAFPAVTMLAGDPDRVYASSLLDLPAGAFVTAADKSVAGPLLACLGTVLAVAAAVVLIRTAAAGGMGSGYVTPAARRDALEKKVFAEREGAAPADDSRAERDLWDALDTGSDPTDPGPDGPRDAV